MLNFSELVDRLNHFWSQKGVSIGQPYGMKLGAGTSNPLTALRVLGPEPFKVAYIEPCRRPADGRYGENPNRLQHYFQYQVVLKPAPAFNTYLYIDMLKAIGIEPNEHDIRFVEDNWESPSLGAWGLGWEIWVDGMEVSQYTYFQQVAGVDLDIPAVEITLGLERLAMYLQGVNHYQDIKWDDDLSYKDLYTKHEYWQSKFNYETSNPKHLQSLYQTYLNIIKDQLDKANYWAAYDNLLELSHVFNLLDARGLISATDRVAKFKQMAGFANQIATAYLSERRRLKFPLRKIKPVIHNLPTASVSAKGFDQAGLYVLELGFEEMPASFLAELRQTFNSRWLRDYLKQNYPGGFGTAEFLMTPQRLVIQISKAKKQISRRQIIKGPPEKLAFGQDQKPTPILANFLKKHKASLDQAKITDGFITLEKSLKLSLQEVIQQIVDKILGYEADTKYMRWDENDYRYIRPLRWIVSFLDDALIPVKAFNLKAGTFTITPRFKDPAKVLLSSSQDYLEFIKTNRIVLDADQRQRLISQDLPEGVGVNPKILTENVFLTESPKVTIQKLPAKYLKLPVQLTFNILEHHQRYLVFEVDNTIYYAVVINHPDLSQAESIGRSNTKVVQARLDDGLFYLEKDIQKPLKDYRHDLDKIIYHPKLGSYLDKTKRLNKLCQLIWSRPDKTVALILSLIKNDKATLSGKEFPELEGVIGAHIAKLQNYPDAVSKVLADYVKTAPATAVGQRLAIVDLIDDVAALSSLTGLPKGNKDPYHIRNKVKRLIKIAALVDIDLSPVLDKALALCKNKKVPRQALFEYINKRLVRFLQSQADLPSYLVQPVAAADGLNIFQKLKVARDLAALNKDKQDLIYDGAKRISNILDQAGFKPKEPVDVNPDLFETKQEKELYRFYSQVLSKKCLNVNLLLDLASKLETFFEAVFVLSQDAKVRRNRLALLFLIKQALDKVFKYTP
ncbi:MAG: glycine--tRNA ligase subunit alpha [bacterium]|nr:glycine--tRNA ligase subunit alpha [bacterium]